jgi:glycosyltransferase involved in cell wall biosynthesis
MSSNQSEDAGVDKKSVTELPAMGCKPKVTIITACRNSLRTMEDTIQSVLGQDYQSIEYIIVDANSSDGTADVINKYWQDIAVWIREPDNGIADAWNKGIKRSTGEVVGIINADDFYLPETVSTVVDVLIRNPQCGFVFGDLRLINDATGEERIERGVSNYRSILRYDMLNIPHPTIFVRKDIYDRLGLFDTTYRIAMDYEFLCRMTSHEIEGKHIPKTLAVMREGGISESNRIVASREVMDISVSYGLNRFWAGGYFLFKCTRTYLGIALGCIGIDMPKARRLRNSIRRLCTRG